MGAVSRILHKDGTTLDILTHNQPTKSHEGWTGHYVHADEPLPYDKFIANKRGLIAHNGLFYMTCTLLEEPWVISDLYDPWTAGDKNIACFFMEMDDNCVDAGGYLPREAIEEFCKFLSDDALEVRRRGRFGSLASRIYKVFRQAVHVATIANPGEVPAHWTRYMTADPHDKKPCVFGWFAVSPPEPESIHLCYREMALSDMTISQMSEEIKTEEARYGEQIYVRVMDPNFGRTPSIQTGRTILESFADNDLFFAEANDDLSAGHRAVEELLLFDVDRPIGPMNYPVLFFADYCLNSIKSMSRYSWMTQTIGKTALKAVPDPKWKDFPDLVRYYAMANPCYIGKTEPQKVVSIIHGRYNLGKRT